MKKKKFLCITLSTISIAIIIFVTYCRIEESAVTDETSKFESHIELVYHESFNEIVLQSWGFNFFYCKDLQMPIFRSASKWNLIYELAMQNFTEKSSGNLELVPCAKGITDFCYLPISNTAVRSKTEPPADADWIPLSPNANGNYSLPLDAIDESNIAIRYSIAIEDAVNPIRDYTFYGILTMVKYQK